MPIRSSVSDRIILAALHAWQLPGSLSIRYLGSGFTSEVWRIEARGERFVAKYAYQAQAAFEGGLYAAEQAEQQGISSGAPIRTKQGALSVLVQGPDSQDYPLALLRFVPGVPLDLSQPDAASLYGTLLGRTHRLLLAGLGEKVSLSLYDFLQSEDAYVEAQPGLATLIRRAVEVARDYEVQHTVTTGVIWADRVEILRDQETGRVGIIDWGAIEHGPLLFDVALSICWYFPEESQSYKKFLQAYLTEAPISVSELEGLNYYKALLWARQAKFFAYRVATNSTLGDADPDGNARSLAQSRQELERLLAAL